MAERFHYEWKRHFLLTRTAPVKRSKLFKVYTMLKTIILWDKAVLMA
jgi:hypothetical protein